MDFPEENMIDKWLEENHNPEIEIQVLNEVVDKLVEERDTLLKQRDEFAIKFIKFIETDKNVRYVGCVFENGQEKQYSYYRKYYNTKELLEIFKKEKGL